MKKVIVIDNYDSFTYNLVHILRELGLGESLKVVRNDAFELREIAAFDYILLSPGPGLPKDAGLMPRVIKEFASEKNILGVCLGHQAIAEAFGSTLLNLPRVFHGMVTPIDVVEEDTLFSGLPKRFDVCRYHSWVVDPENLGKDLLVTSRAENGNIMSIKHTSYNVRGIQFHPESIMTEHGKQLIKNWLGE
ncbi:MAG: aminodeoxychorismate/anthranilate synthase component II [Ekhidna sp.]